MLGNDVRHLVGNYRMIARIKNFSVEVKCDVIDLMPELNNVRITVQRSINAG